MGGRATRDLPFIVLALAGCAVPSARAGGVVGSGTAASCTEAALDSALAGGGTVTFDCGSGAVVIPITSTELLSTSTTIDGTGQQITLEGGGSTRLFQTTPQTRTGLTLDRGLPVRGQRHPGRRGGPVPRRVGGNGGAFYTDGTNLGALTLRRTVFSGNRATNNGGAIYSWMRSGGTTAPRKPKAESTPPHLGPS